MREARDGARRSSTRVSACHVRSATEVPWGGKSAKINLLDDLSCGFSPPADRRWRRRSESVSGSEGLRAVPATASGPAGRLAERRTVVAPLVTHGTYLRQSRLDVA
jgi:hypothetical protein